jgi:non-specific serine/threonine protein kinase
MTDLQLLLEHAETAATHLAGPDQALWLQNLELSLPEFRRMMEGCLARGEAAGGLRLAAALGKFWWMCGHAPEGRRWLEAFLTLPIEDDDLRARALAASGGVAYAQADYPATKGFLEEALSLAQRLGQQREVAFVLNQLGMVAREQGRLAEARELHLRADAIFRHLDDEAGHAACVSNLGVVAYREGDMRSASLCHQGALKSRRSLGDERGVASSLGNLANVGRLAGDFEQARACHEEALAIRRRLGDRWGVAGSLVNLAGVAALAGDHASAAARLGESEAAFRAVGDPLGLCECRDARVLLALCRGERDEARRLLAEAEQARAALGAPFPPVCREEFRRLGLV